MLLDKAGRRPALSFLVLERMRMQAWASRTSVQQKQNDRNR
jgi:hypothetical protein